jgi:DNA-binding PadR family transcriptional regulator
MASDRREAFVLLTVAVIPLTVVAIPIMLEQMFGCVKGAGCIFSILLSILTWRWRMSVRHALLALLSEGPKYGLQLRQEFESRTGEVWPLNVGQVYTTLQRLERDGLVESDDPEGEGPQKGFRITAAGGRELAEWLRTPPETVPPPRDELVIKVLVALRVPGVDVHELIQVHRRHLVEMMQRYTYLKAEAPEHDVGLALVVDAELFRLEGVVRWLDAADARLVQLPAASPVAAPAVPLRPGRRLGVRR